MTNTITKTTLVNAPIEKVWRAVSDHREFGTWFKVDLDWPVRRRPAIDRQDDLSRLRGISLAGVGHRGRGAESPGL